MARGLRHLPALTTSGPVTRRWESGRGEPGAVPAAWEPRENRDAIVDVGVGVGGAGPGLGRPLRFRIREVLRSGWV